ncbi:aspartate kinase [Periweissella cryptocerci]|uniref:Aspartokinase n=1 Tax=Periweissella cryptocerci TaxID=2506420 RepID=A0A4P6YT31_9LACO|nr:aspartate kinase [Periweissella cryptocerci]QBO35793.1 aspartate kinase [Periweissella cryptocerci]
MKVVKFGGSSVANGEQIEKVVNIIRADAERRVIVVSAPGKRTDEDVKVTDLLLKYAHLILSYAPVDNIIAEIMARYAQIAHRFGVVGELVAIRKTLVDLPQHQYPNSEYLIAAFTAHGEKLNALLITAVLNKSGVAARYVDPREAGILVTDEPRNARILSQSYAQIAQLSTTEILVVPGFFGYTKAGCIATFARGGSDITGSILARGLQADLYENFTDVDAIYTANPHVVVNPVPIAKITYREMRELAYAGFSVFHDEALIPAIEGRIHVNIKNTNHPDLPGTLIVPESEMELTTSVTGIASSNHFIALYLHRYLLNKEFGFTLKILNILYRYGVSYEHMPSGIDDLTIIFDSNQLDNETMELIATAIQAEVVPDTLQWVPDYAIIMVVGEGLSQYIGTLERIIAPLAASNVGLQMINKGASRISIMIGVHESEADLAVQQIYASFFSNVGKKVAI